MHSSEQRSHIRVKDRVYLKISMINSERHEKLMNGFEDGSESPWGSDQRIISSHSSLRETVQKIRERDASLAQALELIDNKLNLIINMMEEKDGTSGYRLHNVDISAAGLNVMIQKRPASDQFFDISIGLLPEYYFFRSLGKVARIEEKDGLYQVGIMFTWLPDEDRELLIEHIFNVQVVQLRRRRKKKEKDGQL